MNAALATIGVAIACGSVVLAQTPPQGQQRPTASVNTQPRVDVTNMPRPIDIHDSVWIENLTMLEVRDQIRNGTTSALVLTGGIEENGPYLSTGKHNNVLKATGESIARRLGNALVAPIVTLEPGNPARPNLSPGTIVLSQATYKAMLTDIRMPERRKAGKFVINGVPLDPIDKTIAQRQAHRRVSNRCDSRGDQEGDGRCRPLIATAERRAHRPHMS